MPWFDNKRGILLFQLFYKLTYIFYMQFGMFYRKKVRFRCEINIRLVFSDFSGYVTITSCS